jgi:glycosyltransferase involved in cell wall biosynthesis
VLRPPGPAPDGGRVWQLIDSSTIGGIEKHIAVLTSSLMRIGIPTEIVLYQDHGANPWLAQLADAGLGYRHLDGTVGGLVRAMRASRPALVHTHGYKAGILGRLAAARLAIPSVSTFHMGEAPRFPVSLYDAVDRYSALLSHHIAVSDAIARTLPFSSTVVRNWVDIPAEAPAFPPPPRRIGFVGRLSHEKAPDIFCDLAERFTGDDHAWHVFGDGAMRDELEARAIPGLTFHGMVTDMGRVWSDLGLLVMPSRGEGLPLAAIEAIGAGVPVIASDVGDVAKVVVDGESGWLVRAGDVDDFVNAIRKWQSLSPESARAMPHSAWRHARDNFSEAAGLPDILEIYGRLGVRGAVSKTGT